MLMQKFPYDALASECPWRCGSVEFLPFCFKTFGIAADRDIQIPTSIDRCSTVRHIEQPEEDGRCGSG